MNSKRNDADLPMTARDVAALLSAVSLATLQYGKHIVPTDFSVVRVDSEEQGNQVVITFDGMFPYGSSKYEYYDRIEVIFYSFEDDPASSPNDVTLNFYHEQACLVVHSERYLKQPKD